MEVWGGGVDMIFAKRLLVSSMSINIDILYTDAILIR